MSAGLDTEANDPRRAGHDRPTNAAMRVGAESSICPACHGSEAFPVHAVAGVPVNSTVLLDSAAAAESYPRGDLELVWCPECGLAYNRQFEFARVHYGAAYEESQGASATFRRFAESLAARWIARYNLHGAHALEIGCGKGEFLELFCRLSGGFGTGFDPAWEPSRAGDHAHGRLQYRAEWFDEEHVPFDADIIICRHTLEHIDDVRRFARLLLSACKDSSAVVAIEVPDLRRILLDGAFWDIYYEHASYFTAGALARLFVQAGFDILALDRVYKEQYLVLEARPAARKPTSLPKLADDVHATGEAVAAFRGSVHHYVTEWRQRLAAWEHQGETVVLWGSGSKAVGFLTATGVTAPVAAVVDINPVRHGRYMPGIPIPIVAPETLSAIAPDHVIVLNPIYRDEIDAMLFGMKLSPSLHLAQPGC